MIKNLKKNEYKLKKLEQIEKDYKYIFFFKYTDINTKELILIKKKFKNLNFFFIKQNLIKKKFKNLEGQGSLLIAYSNENIIEKILFYNFYKINLLFIQFENKIFSKLKLLKILNKNNNIKIQLKIFFLPFLYFLRNIK